MPISIRIQRLSKYLKVSNKNKGGSDVTESVALDQNRLTPVTRPSICSPSSSTARSSVTLDHSGRVDSPESLSYLKKSPKMKAWSSPERIKDNYDEGRDLSVVLNSYNSDASFTSRLKALSMRESEGLSSTVKNNHRDMMNSVYSKSIHARDDKALFTTPPGKMSHSFNQSDIRMTMSALDDDPHTLVMDTPLLTPASPPNSKSRVRFTALASQSEGSILNTTPLKKSSRESARKSISKSQHSIPEIRAVKHWQERRYRRGFNQFRLYSQRRMGNLLFHPSDSNFARASPSRVVKRKGKNSFAIEFADSFGDQDKFDILEKSPTISRMQRLRMSYGLTSGYNPNYSAEILAGGSRLDPIPTAASMKTLAQLQRYFVNVKYDHLMHGSGKRHPAPVLLVHLDNMQSDIYQRVTGQEQWLRERILAFVLMQTLDLCFRLWSSQTALITQARSHFNRYCLIRGFDCFQGFSLGRGMQRLGLNGTSKLDHKLDRHRARCSLKRWKKKVDRSGKFLTYANRADGKFKKLKMGIYFGKLRSWVNRKNLACAEDLEGAIYLTHLRACLMRFRNRTILFKKASFVKKKTDNTRVERLFFFWLRNSAVLSKRDFKDSTIRSYTRSMSNMSFDDDDDDYDIFDTSPLSRRSSLRGTSSPDTTRAMSPSTEFSNLFNDNQNNKSPVSRRQSRRRSMSGEISPGARSRRSSFDQSHDSPIASPPMHPNSRKSPGGIGDGTMSRRNTIGIADDGTSVSPTLRSSLRQSSQNDNSDGGRLRSTSFGRVTILESPDDTGSRHETLEYTPSDVTPLSRRSSFNQSPVNDTPISRRSSFQHSPTYDTPMSRQSSFGQSPSNDTQLSLQSSFEQTPAKGTPISRRSSFQQGPSSDSPISRRSSFQHGPDEDTPLSRRSSFENSPANNIPISRRSSFENSPDKSTHMSRRSSFQQGPSDDGFMSRQSSFEQSSPKSIHLSRRSSFQQGPSVDGPISRRSSFQQASSDNSSISRRSSFQQSPGLDTLAPTLFTDFSKDKSNDTDNTGDVNDSINSRDGGDVDNRQESLQLHFPRRSMSVNDIDCSSVGSLGSPRSVHGVGKRHSIVLKQHVNSLLSPDETEEIYPYDGKNYIKEMITSWYRSSCISDNDRLTVHFTKWKVHFTRSVNLENSVGEVGDLRFKVAQFQKFKRIMYYKIAVRDAYDLADSVRNGIERDYDFGQLSLVEEFNDSVPNWSITAFSNLFQRWKVFTYKQRDMCDMISLKPATHKYFGVVDSAGVALNGNGGVNEALLFRLSIEKGHSGALAKCIDVRLTGYMRKLTKWYDHCCVFRSLAHKGSHYWFSKHARRFLRELHYDATVRSAHNSIVIKRTRKIFFAWKVRKVVNRRQLNIVSKPFHIFRVLSRVRRYFGSWFNSNITPVLRGGFRKIHSYKVHCENSFVKVQKLRQEHLARYVLKALQRLQVVCKWHRRVATRRAYLMFFVRPLTEIKFQRSFACRRQLQRWVVKRANMIDKRNEGKLCTKWCDQKKLKRSVDDMRMYVYAQGYQRACSQKADAASNLIKLLRCVQHWKAYYTRRSFDIQFEQVDYYAIISFWKFWRRLKKVQSQRLLLEVACNFFEENKCKKYLNVWHRWMKRNQLMREKMVHSQTYYHQKNTSFALKMLSGISL